MRALYVTLCCLLFSPDAIADEPCGGVFGYEGQRFTVEHSICKSEAIELYRAVSELDFDVSRRSKVSKSDVASIFSIHRQGSGRSKLCPSKGFIVTTNVTATKRGNEPAQMTWTHMCLKQRKGKRLLLNRITNEADTQSVFMMRFLFGGK